MLLQCDNKSCCKLANASLDLETDKVICSECSNPISNVTHYMKKVMKDQGHTINKTRRHGKLFDCFECQAKRFIGISEGTIVCQICKNPMKFTPYVEAQAKESLGIVDKLAVDPAEQYEIVDGLSAAPPTSPERPKIKTGTKKNKAGRPRKKAETKAV